MFTFFYHQLFVYFLLPVLGGKAFTTQFNLSYHYSQEHPKPEVLAAIEANCHICEKVFENAYVLNNHLPTCTKDLKEFHCDKCKYICIMIYYFFAYNFINFFLVL